MITPARWLFAALLVCAVASVYAQGGMRLIVYNYEPVFEDAGLVAHYGIGYDHDLNERVSSAFSFRLAPEIDSYVVNYRSAYHFSDNDRGSFYFGPTVGVRTFTGGDGPTLVPIGLRMGIRGGLERFFADVYAGFQYNAGAGKPVSDADGADVSANAATYVIGFDVGWGWAKKTPKGSYK